MDKNKLKYILIWLCVALVIVLSIFILTKVTEDKKEQEEEKETTEIKYKTNTSYDEKFTIDAPDTYVQVEEKNSLNKKGIIELNDPDKSSYILLVTTSKVNLNKDFNTFKTESFAQKESFYKTKITNYEKVTIDNHDAEYGEIYYTNSTGINIYIRVYVVESDNYFSQLVMWTVADNEKVVAEEYDKIASSLREK